MMVTAMLRMTKILLFLISAANSQSLVASEASFSDIFRKWSAEFYDGEDLITITYMTEELLAYWVEDQDSEYSKLRIQELASVIREEGLQVFLLDLDVGCCITDAVSFAPAMESFRLITTNGGPTGIKPVMTHPTLDLLIKSRQVGVGVVAFKTAIDKYETMTLRVIPTNYRIPPLSDSERKEFSLARGSDKDRFYNVLSVDDYLVPILPDGIHEDVRLSDSKNYSDMLSFLRIALSVARLLVRA